MNEFVKEVTLEELRNIAVLSEQGTLVYKHRPDLVERYN